jgi:hypothetical protein
MRNVFEAFESGPGVAMVCNTGPGGEPVRLVHEPGYGAEMVRFVPHSGPGVVNVNVVEGGMPRAEQAHAQFAAAPAPDVSELNEADDAVLAMCSGLWQQVQEKRGADPDALYLCAKACVDKLDHSFENPAWVEELMMMGGNSAVMLWADHKDHVRAGEVLPALAQEVLSRRWLQGGPRGMFEAHEAQNVMRALGEVQVAAKPGPQPQTGATSAPAEEPKKRRGLFRR